MSQGPKLKCTFLTFNTAPQAMTWNSFIIILHPYLRNWLGFPVQSTFKLDSVSENLRVVARGKYKDKNEK